MTTVREIVIDALEDLVVQSDEAPIEASEGKAAVRALNSLMAKLEAKGYSLGYTITDSLDDEVTIPAGAVDGVIAMLAVRLAPKYKTGDIPPTLYKAEKEGEDTIAHIAVDPGSMDLPSTLPVGSGNDYPDSNVGANDTFYNGDI